MKKILKRATLIIAIILVSVGITAQNTEQNNMTINIGYVNKNNSAKFISEVLGLEVNTADKITIHGITAGFGYDLLLFNLIGFNFGINYTYSFRDKIVWGSNKFTGYKYSYHSLDAPVRFMLSLPLTSDLRLLAFAGPKFTFDLAGTANHYVNGNKVDSNNLYGDSSYRSRFNVLLGPGVGLRYKNFILKTGYDFGLLNLNIDKVKKDNLKITQEQLYVKLGFAF